MGSTDHGWKPQDPFTKNKSLFLSQLHYPRYCFLVMEWKQQIPMPAYSSIVARLTFATLRLHIQLKSGSPFQLLICLQRTKHARASFAKVPQGQGECYSGLLADRVKVWMAKGGRPDT